MTTPIKFNANSHYYQYVSTPIAGSILFNGFNFGTYRGLQGYLSTVTSSAENSLIGSLISVNPDAWVYLGGTDSAVESEWKWVGGPEADIVFWRGYTKVIPGSAVNGAYTNWMTDHLDPVNGQFEHYLVARTSNTNVNGNPLYYEAGAWADSSGNNAYGYVIEFGGLPATYDVTSSVNNVNEGETVTFQISTTNVEWDTLLSYVISGISSSDISSGSLSGSVIVIPNGDKGTASVTLRLTADQITEGTETLTINAGGATASIIVNDTSKAAATYTLQQWPAGTSANEGSQADFSVTTTNVATGTALSYTISGVSAADVGTGSLNGTVTVGSNGVANIAIPIVADSLTEGAETLTVTLQGQSSSIIVNDTSTSINSKIESHNLSVLVDKGVLGPMPFLLKELNESLTYVNGVLTKHSIQYAGINFDYDLIDSLFTTVTRDGEFTAEFTKEINDYVQADANISYKVAVALVGATNIDSVIIMVAGSDGNYVA